MMDGWMDGSDRFHSEDGTESPSIRIAARRSKRDRYGMLLFLVSSVACLRVASLDRLDVPLQYSSQLHSSQWYELYE